MFTVLGSGAAYVVEDHESVTKLFDKNYEILTWTDYDELTNIIDISKKDKNFVRKIGLNGRKKIISYHTIFNRLSLFEKLMNDKIFNDFPKIVIK
jgi:spore maturation protein CgeB